MTDCLKNRNYVEEEIAEKENRTLRVGRLDICMSFPTKAEIVGGH